MAKTLSGTVPVFFLVVTWFATCCLATTPETPEAAGRPVTEETLATIRDSNIFQEDHSYFLRMAAAQTEFGVDPKTYREGYHGGIWQVDEDKFDETQKSGVHSGLSAKYIAINSNFGIAWSSVTWSDLRKPLHSALAAQLFFESVLEFDIPATIEEQSDLFKDYWRDPDCWIFKVKIVIGGDPHVTQMVSGSDIPIRYDVIGETEDIFHFLTDPSANIKMNVQLKSRASGKPAIYVEEIAIFIGQSTLFIKKDGIKIDGNAIQWADNMVQHGHAAEEFVVQVNPNYATIDLSLTQINVTKSRHGLNFHVSHFGSFDSGAKGILGDVANRVSVEDTNLVMTDANGKTVTSKLTKHGDCWKVARKMEEFAKLLTKNQITCITC